MSIHSIIQNAFVHDEITATIHHQQQQPWKLDAERPEYHRVKIESSLDKNNVSNHSYMATSTGVQQSSRLLSLVGADGLMVLPHLQGKVQVVPGESYPVLLLNHTFGKVRVTDSLHIRSAKLTLGIIEFVSNSTKINHRLIPERVYNALGGQNHVCMLDQFYATTVDEVQHLIQCELSEYLDVVVIVGMSIPFLVNLKLSSMLTSFIQKKISDATALVMRKAISSVDPVGVLNDPIFGYYENETKSFIIISVPDCGLEPALKSIAVTLKHTLLLSRG
jgi:hypothetical protein